MRSDRATLLAAALTAAIAAGPAAAQVTTDAHALDQLAPSTPAATPAKPAAPAAAAPAAHRSRHVATPARKSLPAVRMPVAPPLYPVILPPPAVLPAHTPPPPPPLVISADAKGSAVPIPGGTRLLFAPGSALLNAAMLAPLEAIAAEAKRNAAETIYVTAWAPGTPDDPSTPRRLSLDRALAARVVMIHDGIASERVRVVARGTGGIGAAPADRADVSTVAPQ